MRIGLGNSRGFSLIELAMIVGIVGLMAASALQEYRNYSAQKILLVNQAAKKTVSDAMARFFYENKRYPCPADPSLPPSDPQAGIENCLASVSGNGCSGAVCRIDGARTLSTGISTVLTGALPNVSLGVTLQETLDGWGSKMGYTVTESLTQSGNYSDQNGTVAVNVYDPTSDTTSQATNPNVPDPYNPSGSTKAFELAIVSYGPDERGGYDYQGKAEKPCTGLGLDIENCNGDSTILLAPSYLSYVNNAKHFDDPIVITDIQKESDKWQISSTEMNNKTNGMVGIGTSTPAYSLDVNGNILTSKYWSDDFCDAAGTNCFSSNLIAGTTGMTCTDGLLIGFSNNAADCLRKLDPSSIQSNTCSTGQYISGFDHNGKPICSAP